MTATDGSVTAYAAESAPGVLQTTSPFKIIPFESVDITSVRNYQDPNEARDDFFDIEEDLVSRDASLSYRRVFRGYVNDDFIQMALFGRFTRLPYRLNNYGGGTQEISDVDAGTSTFALVDPGPPRLDFGPSFLVLASGFTNRANNGLFLAFTGTNGTTLVITGATLVDETPPPGARLEAVGYQFAAGDLAITGTMLDSTANIDLAALFGLAPGYWVKVGGAADIMRFGAGGATIGVVNDAARIGAIPAAGTLDLDLRPAGWANDAGAGKTIRLFFSEPCRPENIKQTIAWLNKIRRLSDFKRKLLRGLFVERFTIDGAARDYFRTAIDFKGLDFEEDIADPISQAGGPIRETALEAAMVTGFAGQRIYVDGAFSLKMAAIRSSSLVFEPTLVNIDVEGFFGYCDMDRSVQRVRLTGEAHFQTDLLYAEYQNATKKNFVRIMPAGNRAYVMDMKRFQLTVARETLPGRGQPVTLNFEGKATADDAGIALGQFNNFFACHRFNYAEGWPSLAAYA